MKTIKYTYRKNKHQNTVALFCFTKLYDYRITSLHIICPIHGIYDGARYGVRFDYIYAFLIDKNK